MNFFRPTLLFVILWLLNSNAKAQKAIGLSDEKLAFEKIIYHSGPCNGICPQIDLEIDSNNDFRLKRVIWAKKGVADSKHSGSFKGKIDPKSYFNLVATLISSDYTNLYFPPNFCCDLPIKTIIIYANGKRTFLKSMTPPDKAQKLISVLTTAKLLTSLM